MSKKRHRRRKHSSAFPVILIIFLIIILSGIYLMTSIIGKYTPSKTTEDLSDYYSMTSDDQVAVIYNWENSETKGKLINDQVYLPLDYIKENLNSRIYWDSSEELLLYATDSALIKIPADSTDYTEGTENKTSDVPIAVVSEDDVYLLFDFIQQHSDFNSEYYESPSRLVIINQWGDIETASAKKSTEIRKLGGIKSPILTNTSKNDTVTVLARDTKWTKVMTEDGIIGFMRSKYVSDGTTVNVASETSSDSFTHISLDKKICLGWHQVTSRTSNSDIKNVLSESTPINVISPTWFHLSDSNGNIASIASQDYVSYCHERNVDVWALVSNLEDSSVDTSAVLNSTENRTNLINNLMTEVLTYDIDGINVDFESLSEEEVGDSFIEFIRELSIECQQNNIVLSVDNYPPYYFNEFYNRAEQANFADYVILMAYDEHYSGSEAGSVSSISWASDAITNTLETVPADQLILGNPFYTRLWSLDSSSSADSQAIGMNQAAKSVSEAGAATSWNEEAGQNYAEWTSSNGTKYEIWLEDADSVKERMDLMSENSLAGAAFWKLGFESDDVWSIIADYMN